MSRDTIGLERLRVMLETTFGADTSASYASFIDMRYTSATPNWVRALLRDDHTVQYRVIENLDVIGKKGPASLDIATNMAGTGVVLDASAGIGSITLPTIASLIVEKAIFGGYIADDGDVEQAGGSTTTTIDVADGSNWTPGQGIGVQVTAGIIEAREVASRTVNTLTLNTAVSGTPVSGEEVYNAHTIYVAEDPSQSLAFVVDHPDRDNIFWLFGANGSWALTLPMGELPGMAYNMLGADWLHDDSTVDDLGGNETAIVAASYTDGTPTPFVNSELLFAPAGGTTRTAVHVSSVNISPAFDLQPLPSPGGTNGIARWQQLRASPMITGDFTTYWETSIAQDDTWYTARDNKTPYKLQVQVGNVPGSTILISLPQVQITDIQPADSEGLHGMTVSWKALADENTTDQTEEIRRSPIRIQRM